MQQTTQEGDVYASCLKVKFLKSSSLRVCLDGLTVIASISLGARSWTVVCDCGISFLHHILLYRRNDYNITFYKIIAQLRVAKVFRHLK